MPQMGTNLSEHLARAMKLKEEAESAQAKAIESEERRKQLLRDHLCVTIGFIGKGKPKAVYIAYYDYLLGTRVVINIRRRTFGIMPMSRWRRGKKMMQQFLCEKDLSPDFRALSYLLTDPTFTPVRFALHVLQASGLASNLELKTVKPKDLYDFCTQSKCMHAVQPEDFVGGIPDGA